MLAGGVLRFFEQRYDEASRSSRPPAPATPRLPRAREARPARSRRTTRGSRASTSSSRYPKGKDEVLVPYLVDALEAQRAALASALGVAPEGRLTVEIVSDVKELSRVSTLDRGGDPHQRHGRGRKFNKLMILSPKALLKGYDWLDTAAHEYTHLVLTRQDPQPAPIWLQEGLAKWFEADWRGRASRSRRCRPRW